VISTSAIGITSELALRWSIGPPESTEVHRIRCQNRVPPCGHKPLFITLQLPDSRRMGFLYPTAKFGEGYSGAFGQGATNMIQLFENARGSQPGRHTHPMANGPARPLSSCAKCVQENHLDVLVEIASRRMTA
jgi:hypothetical protein